MEERRNECKVEIFSRVTGFFRPVQEWNIGKREEFKDRRKFNQKATKQKGDGGMAIKLKTTEIYDIEKRCFENFERSARLKKQFGSREAYAKHIISRWALGKQPKSTRPRFKRLTPAEEKDICELCYLIWSKSPIIREEFRSKEIFAAYEKALRSGLISE